MAHERAIATSLLRDPALQSLAGFAGHLGHAQLDWAVVVPFTLLQRSAASAAARSLGELRKRSCGAGLQA